MIPKEERVANDDWEAIKILLDAHPSLKQRVLHKLREMKAKKIDKDRRTKDGQVRKTSKKAEG